MDFAAHALSTRYLHKQWDVPQVDDHGNQRVIPLSHLEKTAGMVTIPPGLDLMTKELARFVRKLQPDKKHSYVIVVPILEGHAWGPNRKGDIIYKDHLVPDTNSEEYKRRPYGWTTFKKANFYAHHKNKPHLGDPILGRVIFAAYNHSMEWVETVVEIDRAALGKVDPELLARVDTGAFDVSMGLYSPRDVCTKCGHVRRPRDLPCQHIVKPVLGTVYPDGSVAAMANEFPLLHDISIVHVGADPDAKALAKVASMLGAPPRRPHSRAFPGERPPMEAARKRQIAERLVRKLHEVDPDIDPAQLLKHARSGGLLSSLIRGGVVLRPHEFQTVLLGATEPTRAKNLLVREVTFRTITSPTDADIPYQPLSENPQERAWVGEEVAPGRSWLPSLLEQRVESPFDSNALVSPADWRKRDMPDLAEAYARYLMLLRSRFRTSDRYSYGGGLTGMASDPLMRGLGLEKRGGAGPLIALLPALYLAALMSGKIAKGEAVDLEDPALTAKERLVLTNSAVANSAVLPFARLWR